MQRRKFIKNTLSLFTTSALLKSNGILNAMPFLTTNNELLLQQNAFENDNILVLINLSGGNDGLNTVIPINYFDNLANLRTRIIIPEKKILKITDNLGFHPSLIGFQSLYNDKKISIIHNVGYPNQNRSHFRSADIWNSGSPSNEVWSSGWLGRFFENKYINYPIGFPNEINPDPIAISFGNSVAENCQGTRTNFSFALENPAQLIDLNEFNYTKKDEISDSINFIYDTIRQSNAYTKVLLRALNKGKSKANYDDKNKLAQQLKIVTKLISGGLKTKLFVLTLDGFDTHANQVIENDSTNGIHAVKLKILSDAITTFQNDLKLVGIENRVIGITTSEFGRQIKENSSFGTDHGSAAPLFLFGKPIKQSVIGEHQQINKEVEDQEGIEMQYDFRNIYGSILVDWFNVSINNVKELLYKEFTYIPILTN